MEYPKYDRQLHLLSLMHQWLEEAQAQGVGEPRLEFREESSRLIVRVAAADAEQSLFYEGMQSGDVLRSLQAEGHVELDHEESGPSANTGFISITEKGLEKIRHRRAFESNLPRFFKRWAITLIGSPREIGVSKEWRANWEGRQISVRNWHGLRLRKPEGYLDEFLEIDGRPAPSYRVEKSRFSKDFYGELRIRDGVHQLHAHIGLTAPLLRTGCLIAVDGVVIGGDFGKKFLT